MAKYDVFFDDLDGYGKDKKKKTNKSEATGDSKAPKQPENHLDKMNKSLEEFGVPRSVRKIFE